MTNSANRLFDAAAERILLQTWEQYPSMASRLGLHEYDGRLPSVSQVALAKRVSDSKAGAGIPRKHRYRCVERSELLRSSNIDGDAAQGTAGTHRTALA